MLKNNRLAGDLKGHHAHRDVTLMMVARIKYKKFNMLKHEINIRLIYNSSYSSQSNNIKTGLSSTDVRYSNVESEILG